jgi:hypothetical protein
VPNIPLERTPEETSSIIEFAASIALSAIAACSFKRPTGVATDKFEELPLKEHDNGDPCPICYEDYESLEVSKKRNLEEEDLPRKRRRLTVEQEKQDAEYTRSEEVLQIGSKETQGEDDNPCYKHQCVVLPCNHCFGRSCLYSWFQVNATCPLCRDLHYSMNPELSPPERIHLPNIASLLSPTLNDDPIVVVMDRRSNTIVALPPDTPAEETEAHTVHASSTPTRSPLTSSLVRGLNQASTQGLSPEYIRGEMERAREDTGDYGINGVRTLLGFNEQGEPIRIQSNFTSTPSQTAETTRESLRHRTRIEEYPLSASTRTHIIPPRLRSAVHSPLRRTRSTVTARSTALSSEGPHSNASSSTRDISNDRNHGDNNSDNGVENDNDDDDDQGRNGSQ